MDFGRLFPPTVDDGRPESFILDGRQVAISSVMFLPIQNIVLSSARWVDGGSAPLFSSPSRCIGIVKVCAVHTTGLERTAQQISTYLASITDTGESFVVRNQALHGEDDRISATLEREIPKAILPKDTTAEQMLDGVRMLAEYSVEGENVIHDGSTRTLHPFLQQELGKHTSIAKSTSSVTSKQRPLGMALLRQAPSTTWQARLTPTVSAARLHHVASHVLLFEHPTPEVIGLACAWSNDAALPGYPYPLLLADQMARVTNNERDVWKMILATDEKASKVLSGELTSNNLHAVFEHILYGKNIV